MSISVAMCTYNGDRFLEQQLQSIEAQTRPPTEVVICDDGSTDSTAAIAIAFRDRVSFPVRFYRNGTNLGSTENFQQAIQLCKGELIALCDQDDVWHPGKLSVMAGVLEREPGLAGVFSDANLIDGNGQPVPGSLWEKNEFSAKEQEKFRGVNAALRLVERDTVTGATLLFRASYISQCVPISREWVHDGWIALILASVSELRALPGCLMNYRLHASQQVGAREVPWHTHLSTEKDEALEAHRHVARRFLAVGNKLETLGVNPAIIKAVRERLEFLERRTAILEAPPVQRLLPALSLLPGYRRYRKGVLSLFRDLMH